MPLASQIELPERYRVARHIASGGMASVWEVEDLLLGRIVAVKVLGAQFAPDPVARARFQREARTAAQVTAHPNVVTIYDIGEHGDDAFIVMEHFSGGTVADRLREARDRGRPVDRETALRWLREAAAGLDAAHAAGVVHRDVKPANLLLDAQGRLAVADFGIARLADDTHMTQAGQVLGTAAYLSPEQATGQPATPASDRYALAVVAYELLSGTRPFDAAQPAAQLRQHAEERPPRASEAAPQLPAAVDAALLRGLAKDPAGRPPTATELVDELDRAFARAEAPVETTRPLPAAPPPVREPPARDPEPVAAATPTPAPPPPAAPRRPAPPPPRDAPARSSRLPVVAALALAAVLVGGVVGLSLSGGGDNGATSRGDRASASRSSTQKAAAKPARKPAAEAASAPAAASPQATTTTTTPAAASGADPAAANDQGFARITAQDYAGAVAPLRAAVQGFRDAGRTDELAYYYALYNLGVALNRSGNPSEAIPFLQERLRNPNQQGTVKRELASAMAKVGGAGKPGKAPKAATGQD
ncbi:MAG: eukaryotic-like serine/threonine-protein kinase [Solirubrobacteraceae bacterium]|nr:eukaryotic-like serine/threonine-protein kinase [Solirubrobacteraceae bacterium]